MPLLHETRSAPTLAHRPGGQADQYLHVITQGEDNYGGRPVQPQVVPREFGPALDTNQPPSVLDRDVEHERVIRPLDVEHTDYLCFDLLAIG